MSVREELQRAAAPYLGQGETVQVIFTGQTASPLAAAATMNGGLIGGLIAGAAGGNRLRIFVVTTQRILVLDAPMPRGLTWTVKQTSVVAELPRSTRLGPPSGLWYKIPVDGKRVRVHRRRFAQIREADRLAPESPRIPSGTTPS